MAELSTPEHPRQIGPRQNFIQGGIYEIPAGATHVLVRPKKRGNMLKLIVAFFEFGYPGDFKPSSNAGKYFYRQNGAKHCRISAVLRPSGWNYEVEWLAEQG
jgi:hypothetical protein